MTISTPTYLVERIWGTTNQTAQTTGAFTPSANALLIVSGMIAGVNGTVDIASITNTHTGSGAWTIHVEQTADDVNNNALFIATCQMGASPGSGTVTVNITPTSGRWAFQVHEIASGYDTSTPVSQTKASKNTGSTSISDSLASAPASGSLTFAACGCNFQSGETVLNLAPGAWADAELRESNSTGAISCSVSAAYDAGGSQSANWTNLENNNNLIGIIEIAEDKGITVTTPVAWQGYQRNGSNQADIPITGAYTGTPVAIEASFNGGAYQTIDAAPAGGAFSGTLTNQAMGQGTLTVRFTNDTGISGTVTKVTIGDVYVIAGQSNANAWGLTQNPAAVHATLDAVMYRIDATDATPYVAGTWMELADYSNLETTPVDQRRGSPYPRLAELMMADTDVPFIMIQCARGGTGLVSSGEWEKTGTFYERMIDRIQGSGVNDVKAILWNQGGHDVNAGVTRSAYLASLRQMLDDAQTDTGFAGMKMVCTAFEIWLGASPPSDDNQDAIRLAHIDAWDQDADILPGPAGHTENFAAAAPQSGIHWYSDVEMDRLADRWWRCLQAAFYAGSNARAPKKYRITWDEGTGITVKFAGGVAPLQNATTVTGWEVKDSGTPITINSAALNGSNNLAVDLTLASTPSAFDAITVSWAHGNNAAANPLVDSHTLATMPPEPFIDAPLSPLGGFSLPLLRRRRV